MQRKGDISKAIQHAGSGKLPIVQSTTKIARPGSLSEAGKEKVVAGSIRQCVRAENLVPAT
jgi:hypothetical protein